MTVRTDLQQIYPESDRLLGAIPLEGGGTSFRVWAPKALNLSVRLYSGERTRTIPLRGDANGYFTGAVAEAGPGDSYYYLFDDGSEMPDPASRFQPEGVHGPSRIVDLHGFSRHDGGWTGVSIDQYVIYELHVGTFTEEGTFAAVIPHLDYLADLGITAVELMPVAQFPGERNWGYDGVYPFAPQQSYGGPDGLMKLVDACHRKGLAVILDVVYNHLGPEGNYLACFGHYFTGRYRTPWGDAVNFDGPYSDDVRRYFIGNALHWLADYHIDALRLDAVHGIFDFSARPFLLELAEAVHEQAKITGKALYVIAESSLNDVRTITPPESGGHGMDAQWNDDFHHALRTCLTGERDGYYVDFGEFSQLVKSFREGFVYSGQYSRFRKRRHGSSSSGRPPRQLVVFSQNHDQVGNRMRGDRPGATLSPEQLRLAAGAVLLSPYVPLLFMGEEYGESAPFPYFISHGDPDLVEAVRQGRREEFASFSWQGEIPDPQAEETFRSARINPGLRAAGMHRHLHALYRELIRLRKENPALRRLNREETDVSAMDAEKVIMLRRYSGDEEVLCLLNFNGVRSEVKVSPGHAPLRKILDSADEHWGGEGSPAAGEIPAAAKETQVELAPWSFVVYGTARPATP